MTKEQEEAIEYLKKHIKYFEEQIKFIEATDCDYYDEELELYQNRVKQFNIVLSMLKEKDQIIDLMAEEFKEKTLMYSDFTKEEVKQYFKDKAKELLNK
jgi:hypothetical protein